MGVAGTTNRAYDAAAQVTGFTYDPMGRQTADGTRTYVWDLASRLTSYTGAAATVSFTYDAMGNRLSRTEGGASRTYVWNYALDLPSVSVVKNGATDLRYYVHTPGGRLLYSIEAGDDTRRDYHFDETGNTLFLTDGGGAVIASYSYSPFGDLLSQTGAIENPHTWQGQFGVIQEGVSGLYSMRARYYDSVQSRFISRDPVRLTSPRGVNPYQYGFGNPLSFVDPRGREPEPTTAPTLLDTVMNLGNVASGAAALASQVLEGRPEALETASRRLLGLSDLHQFGRYEALVNHRVNGFAGAGRQANAYKASAEKLLAESNKLRFRGEKLASIRQGLAPLVYLGKFFSGASVASSLFKLHKNLRQTRNQYDDLIINHNLVYIDRSNTAWDLYRSGVISEDGLRAKLDLYQSMMDLDRFDAGTDALVNGLTDFWTGTGDIFGAFVPFYDLVGTEAIGNAAHQTFFAPDASSE